ncbi:MAG: hypothetical protein ACE5GK_02450 [Nitrospiria bacterium]
MAEKEDETAKAGMGQKIVFGLMMVVASGVYYLLFLNWVLMVPAQNLPYPYK